MKILGIHDGHNSTASLMTDGKVKWVIQEERLRHEKNYDGFPSRAIEKILVKERLMPSEIDAIIFNGNHQPKAMSRLERVEAYKRLDRTTSRLKAKLKYLKVVDDLHRGVSNQVRIANATQMGFDRSKINFVDHHAAHASAAYYGYGNYDDDVLILTNDGAGDRLCASISIGSKGKIERISEVHENHSIGLIYAMFTFLTGMVPLEHEYKIMGMAPYADMKGARKIADDFHSMFNVSGNGLTWEFTKGKSIYQSMAFFKDFMCLKRFDHLMGGLQIFVEEFLTSWVKSAISETNIRKVALSGGTFMNVKANKAIMELAEIEELFIYPSCGDESNAIGVMYKHFAEISDYRKIEKLEDIYFGVEWSNEDILKSFNSCAFEGKYTIDKLSNIEHTTAKILAQGNVVARFKGREEFGARSLGNRAILGNPSSSDVIKTINELIKNRDFWMPFASSILDTDIEKYVNINAKNVPYYMIMTYDTKEEAEDIVGGIHPYDRTVRPQLVTASHNKSYWNVLNEFKELTGIGGILNTSLNLHGLPLVHSPEDAFEVLEKSKLKYLAIEDYLITKVE